MGFPAQPRQQGPQLAARRNRRPRRRRLNRGLWLGPLIGLGLASCVPPPRPQPVASAPAPTYTSAIEAGVRAGPRLPAIDAAKAREVWAAFKISCPSLTSRDDASGLARPGDWREVCAAEPGDPASYLRRNFELVEVGDGAAFATGYYEPEVPGCRTREPGCEVPVYRKPPELLEANPMTGERRRGRMNEHGVFLPYHDRGAIEDGAIAGRGLELAYVRDPVDLFFVQIQGSGRVRMADGSVMRIGYAGQNGREYVAIGRLLRERNILALPISMQRIREWIAANPAAGTALMRENMSYVFFQELTGPGPLGALGRPVTAGVTVATDPRFVPLGAPVLLTGMDNPHGNGLWVAQDTGGAIRGTNRFDTFWGAGEEAARIAGSMSSRGRAFVLLPRGALRRIRDRAQAQR